MTAARPFDGAFEPLALDAAELAAEIAAARERIARLAVRTPTLRPPALEERLGAAIGLKCENFQRTGAFKFRGACNAIAQLDAKARETGVLTYSSGNHGQALALAGKLHGVSVTVVMPADAPAIKRRATESHGARVITYDPFERTREEIAAELARERPYTLIPPYDHPHVIAGQGTLALELIEQMPDPELVLVPTGGAGLLSGVAAALHTAAPGCRVVGVEPELADDATQSFRTGMLHTVKNPPTIADGVRTPYLGRYTFPLVRELVADMVTVREEAIVDAMRYSFETLKLVLEPAAVLGLAALLDGVVAPAPRTAIVLSGGNVDAAMFARLID